MSTPSQRVFQLLDSDIPSSARALGWSIGASFINLLYFMGFSFQRLGIGRGLDSIVSRGRNTFLLPSRRLDGGQFSECYRI
jgi:hypothetical protein